MFSRMSLIVAGVAVFSAFAAAAIVDDFESYDGYSSGSAPVTGNWGYYGGSGTFMLNTDSSHAVSGNQSLGVDVNGGSLVRRRDVSSFDAAPDVDTAMSIKFYDPGTTAEGAMFGMMFSNGSYAYVGSFWGTNYHMSANFTGAKRETSIARTVGWHDLTFERSVSDGNTEIRTYIDGTLATCYNGGEFVDVLVATGTFTFGYAIIADNVMSNEDGTFYFDNLAINEIPEPATIALALMGTAGLVRRKK